MTNEELVKEIREGRDTDEHLLQQLFIQNSGLIELAIRPYCSICERDDLRQEALCGLLQAVEKFDPGKECSFAVFCQFWVKQCVRRYVYQSGGLRLPEYLVMRLFQMNRFIREYEAERGYSPSDSVLCAVLQIRPDELQSLKRTGSSRRTVSLFAPLDEGDDTCLADTLQDEKDSISDSLDEIERTQIQEAVNSLNDECRQAIQARYFDGLQYRQIAALCGKSVDMVRKIEKTALRQLKRDFRIKEAGQVRGYYSRTSKTFQGGLRRFLEGGESIVESLVLNKLDLESGAHVVEHMMLNKLEIEENET